MHIIVMVGLPGRGKSYMAMRLCRWLQWKNIDCKIFNAGDYRRKFLEKEHTFTDYSWFSPNSSTFALKENIAESALKDLINWMKQESSNKKVAIFDATNSTNNRRDKIKKMLSDVVNENQILFVESICDDQSIINSNFIEDKKNNEDYVDKPVDDAHEDFQKRIKEYEKNYESINDNEIYIKIYNIGKKFIMNKLSSNFQTKMAYFLMNLNKKRITIYLTRHGQSQDQLLSKIGGNSNLTDHGKKYADRLLNYFDLSNNEQYDILCSDLMRAKNTANVFRSNNKYNVEIHKELNEIYGGEFEGMTYEQIKEKHPLIYNLRDNNKYKNSWPGGESYYDLTVRLEPILLRIECNKNKLIIVAHQAICRIFYAYLMNIDPKDCVNLEIKSHRLYEFTQEKHHRQVKWYDL
jgi:broad specificity phosphatase PhoE/adenylate kinase family enzyme